MLFVVLNFVLLPYLNINIILLIDIVVWTVFNMVLSYIIKKKNGSYQ